MIATMKLPLSRLLAPRAAIAIALAPCAAAFDAPALASPLASVRASSSGPRTVAGLAEPDPGAAQTPYPPLLRSGTAFVVSRDGYMLTGAHVVRDCRKIEIWPRDAPADAARLVAIDERLDLALLATHRIVGADWTTVAATLTRLPTVVYTIGYGLTPSTPRVPVLTRGILDGVAARNGRPVLVIRAPLHEGNSGGPVIDANGALLGMIIGRYVARPDLSVAVRRKEITAFLRANGVEFQAMKMSNAGADAGQEQLWSMASLVQCVQAR
jgi:S1-C subfamily serine protease